MAGETPLNELLSHALLSFTRAYEKTDPTAPALPFYANLLRVVDGPGADFRNVAVDARISRRVAKTLLTEASHLSDIDKARTLGAQTLAAAEAAWKPGAKLRKPLEALVAQFDLEHPHFWMQYGAADMSAIGGRWPSHGTDWKPVMRTEPLGELPELEADLADRCWASTRRASRPAVNPSAAARRTRRCPGGTRRCCSS